MKKSKYSENEKTDKDEEVKLLIEADFNRAGILKKWERSEKPEISMR